VLIKRHQQVDLLSLTLTQSANYKIIWRPLGSPFFCTKLYSLLGKNNKVNLLNILRVVMKKKLAKNIVNQVKPRKSGTFL